MNCARCGEEIEKGYEYEGKMFGAACIKIVIPSSVRKPKSSCILKADSFTETILKNGRTRIMAKVNERKFYDFIYLPTEHQRPRTILIESNEAYILI